MENEYIDLWYDILQSQEEFLPIITELGLANTEYKINSDSLDTIQLKQRQISALTRELTKLDDEYSTLISETKKDPLPEPVSNNNTRITDFLISLILSLRKNFANFPDLMHAMQKIYLYNTKN